MDNYTPNPFMTQPVYDPTRPFATPSHGLRQREYERESGLMCRGWCAVWLVCHGLVCCGHAMGGVVG